MAPADLWNKVFGPINKQSWLDSKAHKVIIALLLLCTLSKAVYVLRPELKPD